MSVQSTRLSVYSIMVPAGWTEVCESGPSAINGSLYVTEQGDTLTSTSFPQLPVWTFEPNWKSEVIESFEWLTDVLRSPTGAEQRRGNRDTPRRRIEFDFLVTDTHRAYLNNFVHGYGANEIYVPLFYDPYVLSGDAVGGTVAIPCNPQESSLVTGQTCVIINPDNPFEYEIVKIGSVGASTVNTAGTLNRTWPQGSVLYRVVRSRFDEQPSLTELSDTVQEGTVRFVSTEKNVLPFPNTARGGPMITRSGLVADGYQANAGTGSASNQFILAGAMLAAADVLRDEVDYQRLEAADFYLDAGLRIMDAIGNGRDNTPILRSPIVVGKLNLPHSHFAARRSIATEGLRSAEFDQVAGQITITPGGYGGEDVVKVHSVYEALSSPYLPDPWTPAYDIGIPIADTSHPVTEWVTDDDGTVVTMPSGTTGIETWKVLYTQTSRTRVQIGQAYTLAPVIKVTPSRISVTYGDVPRFADRALRRAMQLDPRSGKPTYWTNMLNIWRESAIRARDVDDMRWIFRPLIGVPAIPNLGSPYPYAFCRSDHPSARPPASSNNVSVAWTGYDFWSRADNGDIIGKIPTSTNVQINSIGVEVPERWKGSSAWQSADSHVFVSITATKKPVAAQKERVLVWLSAGEEGVENVQTWYADIGSLPAFVATTALEGQTVEFFVPLASFKLMARNEDGTVTFYGSLPVNQIIRSAGISVEMKSAYVVRLREMRIVTSANAAGKAGYPMAFAPGVAPFQTISDLRLSQIAKWKGWPFIGHQLPDFWWFAKAQLSAVMPVVTSAELPVPSRVSTTMTYPISPTTSGGTAKTPAAMLIEQQLRFLDHAQIEYAAHSSFEGPFAFGYSWNTSERFALADDAHNTWTYESLDLNPEWLGHQYRVAESLGALLAEMDFDPAYADARALAQTILAKYMAWTRLVWYY